MRQLCKAASQLLALLLTFAVIQVYVFAAPLAKSEGAVSTSSSIVFGRLTSYGTNKVVVNGNEVLSGTSIVSGSQIQTPDATGATITLGSVGRLDVSPKTNLTVSFDRNSVTVNVVSGDARLAGSEGVKGAFTGPDGKTKIADGTRAYSIGTAMYGADGAPAPQGNKCEILGMPCALFWAMVGGGTLVAILFAATRGNNPSQSNP